VKGAKVRFGQSLPPFAASGCPKVARQAAGETFAAVIDLDQHLLAVVATGDVVRHVSSSPNGAFRR